ncbi:unnamed protein product [Callosobruchus maculatus]|uniref:Odorant receptor n=1 Tax=Callosobruchus maculatus TaxID=64391 RepID=A0A653BG76_CALMS|nr:unnamed protein product [Callosobruchus maculatus]
MKRFVVIEHCLVIMNVIGVHPAKVGSYSQLLIFLFYVANYSVMTYLVVMLFVDSPRTLMDGVLCFTNLLVQLHAVLYLTCLYIERSNIMKLLVQMDEKFWRVEECKNVQLREECLHTLKMLKVKYRTFLTMILTCALSYFYGRLIENRTADPENLIFESYIPEGVSFWTLFIWEHLPSTCLMLVEISMDFIIFSMVSLTALQFKMLAYEMNNIFALEDDLIINARFKKCNDQLTFLLSFRTLLNNTFSAVVLLYLGVIILILCIEIYFIMSMDSLEEIIRAVVYAALMFFEFFICYCFPAQALVDESEKVVEGLYNSKWYQHMGTSKTHAKATVLLQGKSQLKVMFTVGGFLNLNLQTGLSAVKTMVSYSMFLRTMTVLAEEMNESIE